MYINSFCCISPGGLITRSTSSTNVQIAEGRSASCIEPAYTDLIPPMQLRRMTKPVRIGIAAAKICLKDAEISMPDAIHTGTAYGMLQDSEQFLQKMIVQEEQMLNPTAFIQSTHNTVAGQIALSLGCNGHNMTYVHKGHSFESALLDAALMLAANPEYEVLAGAVDESTDTSFRILERFGIFKEHDTAGEGASFFSISGERKTHSIARLEAFDMIHARDEQSWQAALTLFLGNKGLVPAEGDLLLNESGFPQPASFGALTEYTYRQYSGLYPTVSAFGLAFGCLLLEETGAPRCWIMNGFGNHYSVFLLSRQD